MTNPFTRTTALACLLLTALGNGTAAQNPPAPGKTIYENNFEQAALDQAPDDFLVLEGAFAVRAENNNRFLELPGAPLDTFGVLFGPTESADTAVSARIFGTGKGRRFPAFALGLNGQGEGSYRLQVSPAKKLLELYKGTEVVATVPHAWESGTWTMLRLQVRKLKDGEWKVEGKVWNQAAAEPANWTITYDDKSEPPAGRASVWGNPFSGTPIRFDDFRVTRLSS